MDQAHVGLYLSGDREANALAEQLCDVQEADAPLLSKQLADEAERLLASMHEATGAPNLLGNSNEFLHSVFRGRGETAEAERAKAAMLHVQEQLARLSGMNP